MKLCCRTQYYMDVQNGKNIDLNTLELNLFWKKFYCIMHKLAVWSKNHTGIKKFSDSFFKLNLIRDHGELDFKNKTPFVTCDFDNVLTYWFFSAEHLFSRYFNNTSEFTNCHAEYVSK